MSRTSRGAEIRPSKIYRGSKTEVTEFVVETDGLSFGIIYGECESGYFIAIPNFGVSVQIGPLSSAISTTIPSC